LNLPKKMSLVHILGYNIQFNATKEFEIPEEPLGLLLDKESSSEDVQVMVGMLEQLGKKNWEGKGEN
jgi:hypothetical protein